MSVTYSELLSRFKGLTERHTKRNRFDSDLDQLLADLRETRDAAPSDRFKIALLAAEAWERRGVLTAALQACVEAAECPDPVIRKKALTKALRFVKKFGQQSYNHRASGERLDAHMNDVKNAVVALHTKYPDEELATEIWYSYLTRANDFESLVEHGERSYAATRSAKNLGQILEGLFNQSSKLQDWSALTEGLRLIESNYALAAEEEALTPALSILCAAGQPYQPDAEIRRILENAPALSPFALYQASTSPAKAKLATNAKPVWLDVYEGDERLKRKIVEDLLRASREAPALPAAALWAMFTRATMNKGFWADQAFQNHVLSSVEALLPEANQEPFHHWCRAALHSFEGKFTKAKEQFTLATVETITRKGLKETPANSFFPAFAQSLAVYDPEDPAFGVAAAKFEPPKASAIPDGPVIICCADSRFYMKHAFRYTKSLRKTGSKMALHFHVAGKTDEVVAVAARLEREFGKVSVSYETPPVAKPYYYASMRLVRGPTFREWFPGDILITDIDISYHKAPESFMADPQLLAADAGFRIYNAVRVCQSGGPSRLLYRYPRLLPWGEINAACIVLRNTPGGCRLTELLSAEMVRHLNWARKEGDWSNWYVDQNAIFAAYHNVRHFNVETKIANIEDVGMPYGGFLKPDHAALFPPVGSHPLFSDDRRQGAPAATGTFPRSPLSGRLLNGRNGHPPEPRS